MDKVYYVHVSADARHQGLRLEGPLSTMNPKALNEQRLTGFDWAINDKKGLSQFSFRSKKASTIVNRSKARTIGSRDMIVWTNRLNAQAIADEIRNTSQYAGATVKSYTNRSIGELIGGT